ncbi:MAG TPA: hypothetical protein VHD61_09950 [Lacunisphaera sp.]|nr:hypothetical protein [Lacunisphaera sp.]
MVALRSGLRAGSAAFTLVEILIGSSLALMVMTAVLTTYVTIGRNFTRSLGVSSANQPTLASQARRTLTYFTQDVRMASGIASSTTPSSITVTLSQPTGTGSKTVSYYLNTTTSPASVTLSGYSVTVPAQSLVRVDGATGTMQRLQSSLYLGVGATNAISYYDSSGNPYTSYTNYLSGIKQISLSFSSQAGNSSNGTLTQVYYTDSARVLLRNQGFLQ